MDATTIATAMLEPLELLVLVDIDDLEDGDLAGRLAEISMPAAAAPAPRGNGSTAHRQAGVDAVVAAWTVTRHRRDAVQAHRLGARAAALLA